MRERGLQLLSSACAFELPWKTPREARLVSRPCGPFFANFRKSLFSNGLKINKKIKIFVANGAGRCSSLFRQSKQVMNNKEITLSLYAAAVESAYKGKGDIAREIISSAWDSQADYFVDQARLDQMGYKLDTKLAMVCVRGIVERNRSLDVKLKSLKS